MRIKGSRDNDTLNGTNRGDRIEGRDGDDTIFGNAGNDFIEGGKGNDHLYGGTGNDTFEFGLTARANNGADTIHDFNVGDHIGLSGPDYTITQVGADVHITYGGNSSIVVIGANLSDVDNSIG